VNQLRPARPTTLNATRSQANWIPAAIALATCGAALLLWMGMVRAESRNLLGDSMRNAQTFAKLIEHDLDERLKGLQGLKKVWEFHGGLGREEWLVEARSHTELAPGLNALGWVNREGEIRWSFPQETENRVQGLSMLSEPGRKRAFEVARDTGATTLTPMVELRAGGEGLIAFIPLKPGERFDGAMVAVIEMGGFLRTLIQPENFSVSVSHAGRRIFGASPGASGEDAFSAHFDFKFHDVPLTVEATPSAGQVESQRSSLPWIVLAVGFVFAFLLSVTARLFLVGRRTQAELIAALANEEAQAVEIESQQVKIIQSSRLAALGEMAGGIAHEINNPLAIINIKAEQIGMMALRAQGAQSSKIEELATGIQSTVQRIARIVKGLRAFARESDKDPFQLAEARTLFDDTISLCSERFRNHGVTLKVSSPEVGATLECRQYQIAQVILNLMNNAFDAVRESPRLGADGKPEEMWVSLGVDVTEEHLFIHVTDNGPGVPKELREKIMQAFFTTKKAGVGTGLGLSISRGIVVDHGGTLYLDESQAGQTRFVIKLPRSRFAIENPEKIAG
jgi:signal transduction histidine kinase